MEWQEVKNDTDVNCINELYNYFEDAILVKMEYVSGDYDFIEDHTALSDSIIEMRILFYALFKGAEIDGNYKPFRSLKRERLF